MSFDIQNLISTLNKQGKTEHTSSGNVDALIQQLIASQGQPSYTLTSGTIFSESNYQNQMQTLYDNDGTVEENNDLQNVVKDVYDDNGVLSERLLYDENGSYTGKMSFESDPISGINRTTLSDASGHITEILESKQNPDGSTQNISKDAYGNTTETITKPDGTSLSVNKDSNGKIQSATKVEEKNGQTIMTTFNDQKKKTSTQITQNGEVLRTINYSYNSLGQLEKSIYRDASGDVENKIYYSYNNDGQIAETTKKDANNKTVEILESTYNPDGTRTTIRKNGDGEILETLTYDSAGNLIDEE